MLLALFLSACQQSIPTDVTRFNALPMQPTGQSFTIIAEGSQIGSLEFQRNAELVAAQLQRYAFVAVPPHDKNADLVVFLRHGTDDARTIIYDDDWNMYAGYGSWGRGVGYWGGAPLRRTSSQTYYDQRLEVEILDGAAFRRNERQMVFQGRAIGQSLAKDSAAVMPAIARALFQNFPGGNGETIRVNAPLPD